MADDLNAVYEQLLNVIVKCPQEGVGEWAVDTMKTLERCRDRGAAIDFAKLLVSGTTIPEGIDKSIGYLTHILEQESAV